MRCLLPEKHYKVIAPKEDDGDEKKDDDEVAAEPDAEPDAIGAKSTNTKGSLLTLSFHVKEERVIKLYLFCNGQSIRFMPDDVRDILPTLFNMDYGGNAKWIKLKDVQGYIDQMKDCLVDDQFTAFQQSFLR